MAGFKIKINIDKAQLKKVVESKFNLIQHNLVAVLERKAIPRLIAMIMEGYDGLADRASQGPDDPTNPANWRTEFLFRLEQDLQNTFIVAGNRISVKLGSKEFLGYDASGGIPPDDNTPLHWLVFYIEGLLGDWAFVTPEMYKSLSGGKYNPEWGRFGQGFMVSRDNYEKQGWSKTIPFEQARHPFSGFSPLDIFAEALREFKIRPFVQEALDAAARGKRL